jgi:hypothetical protein
MIGLWLKNKNNNHSHFIKSGELPRSYSKTFFLYLIKKHVSFEVSKNVCKLLF